MVGGDGTGEKSFYVWGLSPQDANPNKRRHCTPSLPKTLNTRLVVLSNQGPLHLPQLRETMPVPVIDTAKT